MTEKEQVEIRQQAMVAIASAGFGGFRISRLSLSDLQDLAKRAPSIDQVALTRWLNVRAAIALEDVQAAFVNVLGPTRGKPMSLDNVKRQISKQRRDDLVRKKNSGSPKSNTQREGVKMKTRTITNEDVSLLSEQVSKLDTLCTLLLSADHALVSPPEIAELMTEPVYRLRELEDAFKSGVPLDG